MPEKVGYRMANPEWPEHVATAIEGTRSNGQVDVFVACSCGAAWSHPWGTGRETMKSVYESHVAYTKKMATRVD